MCNMQAGRPLLCGARERNSVVKIASELIGLESDSMQGHEGAVGEYVAGFFERLGLPVERETCAPGRYNVIARIPGRTSEGSVLYSGHLDTVPIGDALQWTASPLAPEIRDGKLYGRGASDMKGSIACSLAMAEYLVTHQIIPKHTVELVYDVDEENTNLGLRRYLETPRRTKFAVVGEPTELKLAIGHRGVMAFTVTLHGKSAHAAQAALGKNAIYAAVEVVKGIRALAQELEQQLHPLLGAPSLQVTQIFGGDKVNVIPDCVKLRIDRRLLPGETRESCCRQLEDILQDVQRRMGFGWELETTTYCPPGAADPENLTVRWIGELLREAVLPWQPVAFGASCEAGMLQERLQIPVVILGPGSLSQAHQIDEFISLEQLYKGLEVYIQLFSGISLQ